MNDPADGILIHWVDLEPIDIQESICSSSKPIHYTNGPVGQVVEFKSVFLSQYIELIVECGKIMVHSHDFNQTFQAKHLFR